MIVNRPQPVLIVDVAFCMRKITELDLEAIAAEGNTVYAIGSHSMARAKLKPTDSYEQARVRMATIKDDTDRSVRPGCANLKLTPLPLPPAIQFSMPSKTLFPPSSSLNPSVTKSFR